MLLLRSGTRLSKDHLGCGAVINLLLLRRVMRLLKLKIYLRLGASVLLPRHDEGDVSLRQVHGGRVPGVADQPGPNCGLDDSGAIELEVQDRDEQVVRHAKRGGEGRAGAGKESESGEIEQVDAPWYAKRKTLLGGEPPAGHSQQRQQVYQRSGLSLRAASRRCFSKHTVATL